MMLQPLLYFVFPYRPDDLFLTLMTKTFYIPKQFG